jgi:hypothetical protein
MATKRASGPSGVALCPTSAFVPSAPVVDSRRVDSIERQRGRRESEAVTERAHPKNGSLVARRSLPPFLGATQTPDTTTREPDRAPENPGTA